jgi:hypothetical protein
MTVEELKKLTAEAGRALEDKIAAAGGERRPVVVAVRFQGAWVLSHNVNKERLKSVLDSIQL